MLANKIISLSGSSGVGKSTIYHALQDELNGYTFCGETTRSVHKLGININEAGTDASQLLITGLHLANLNKPGDLILDRSLLDCYVYTKWLHIRKQSISYEVYNFVKTLWEKYRVMYTHFIYFPIEFSVKDDGVRSIDESWREEIDRLFYIVMKEYHIDFLEIHGTVDERLDQIRAYVREE